MKTYYVNLALTTFLIQGAYSSQANSLDVQVRQLPSYDEGTFYDQSGEPKREMLRSSNQTQHSLNRMNQKDDGIPNEVMERTLSIIKPDAVQSGHIGNILSRFEQNGLRIVGLKMIHLTKDQAGRFYAVHQNRPFYRELTEFMASGPIVVIVLEGQGAIAKNRKLMGATDPKKAEKGTLRADFAESVSHNAVHGSDSPEAAREEIPFFFKPEELHSR
jgi:nucleoside-diphosphate kinase